MIGVIGVAALWAGAAAWKSYPIERRLAQNTVAELKRRGLDRRFEQLVLDVNGRAIAFTGTALTEGDRQALIEAAAATPGVGAVTAEIAIAPVASPFVFRVERDAAGKVRISGSVPDPESLEKLGERARALFGRDAGIALRMARGVPEGDWQAAARAAIEMAALVEQGEAVLSDRTLAFRGRAAGDTAMDTATVAFARLLPRDYRGTADVFTALDADLRSGPVSDTAACQALIDRVNAAEAIRFAPGSAELLENKPRLFDRLGLAARRCTAGYLQIHAAGDSDAGDPAANMRLGEARARAVAELLAQRAVARDRVSPRGRLKADARPGDSVPAIEFRMSETALPVAKPFVWQIRRLDDGTLVITGNHPSAEAAAAILARATPVAAGAVSDASRIALGAPPGDWAAAAGLAVEAAAALVSGGATLADTKLLLRGVAKDDETLRTVRAKITDGLPIGFRAEFAITTALDEELRGPSLNVAGECQALLEKVARTEGVEFVFDGATLYGRHRQFFERLAAAMTRCPEFAVEIGGHTSGGGDPDAARALAERWAQAVAEAVMRAGAERVRVRAVGYGNARPVADVNTEAGRQRNRRVVFRFVS